MCPVTKLIGAESRKINKNNLMEIKPSTTKKRVCANKHSEINGDKRSEVIKL